LISFRGSCDSLSCDANARNNVGFEDAQAGTKYYVYVYRNASNIGDDPYTLTLDYLTPPTNDNMQNAVAITQSDLPFRSQFSTYGALSDASQDACALSGDYGSWFSYMTTISNEPLTVSVATGMLHDNIGIQYQLADGSFACVGTSGSSGSSIEWTAQANTQYYILVSVSTPDDGHSSTFTLLSRSSPAPTSTVATNPPTVAPVSPAPSTSMPTLSAPSPPPSIRQESSIQPTSNNVANAPTNVPTGLNSDSQPLPSSSSSLSDKILGTQFFLATMLFLVFF
jgi:hypothetical protein